MFRILSVCLFWPFAALAADYPALHNVTGVASNDVLNIRAEPGGGATILGTLPPGARDVEVVALNDTGTWGRVNLGEVSGWVSMRFLARTSPETFVWPQPMLCGGVEPFWSMRLDPSQMAFTLDGQAFPPVFLDYALRAPNDTRRYAAVGDGLTATVSRGACTDGMSDRVNGLTMDVVVQGNGGALLVSGCCVLGQ